MGGFFRVWQDAAPTQGPPNPLTPGVIPTFVTSRSMLHFTVVQPGVMPNEFFATDVVGNAWTGANGGTGAGNQLFDTVNDLPSKIPYSTYFNQDQRFQFPRPATAPNPPTQIFKSPYAEVAWWLTKSQSGNAMTPTDAGQTSQQLYTLHRRYRLLWPENNVYQPPPGGVNPTPAYLALPLITPGTTGLDEISIPNSNPQYTAIQVNRMAEITLPPFRLGMTPTANLPGPYGANPALGNAGDSSYAGVLSGNTYPIYADTNNNPLDIVIDGVLSFDVRVLLWDYTKNAPASDFVDLTDSSVTSYSAYTNNMGVQLSNNPQYVMTTGGAGPWVFDTWSQQQLGSYDYSGTSWSNPGTYAAIPTFKNPTGQTIRILAIQITLRLYDFKTETTRQVTMVQNL
jgi:hypothetical protein